MTKQTNTVRSKTESTPGGVGSATPQRRKATGRIAGAPKQMDSARPGATGNTGSPGSGRSARVGAGAGDGARMTKQEHVLTLLNRTAGASIEEVMATTGWQQHSVRGFFAGTVKKKLGFNLVSSRDGAEARRYRIDASGKKGTAQ